MLHYAGYQLLPFLIFFLVAGKAVAWDNQPTGQPVPSIDRVLPTLATAHVFPVSLAIAV
jgi:hypothetical protein